MALEPQSEPEASSPVRATSIVRLAHSFESMKRPCADYHKNRPDSGCSLRTHGYGSTHVGPPAACGQTDMARAGPQWSQPHCQAYTWGQRSQRQHLYPVLCSDLKQGKQQPPLSLGVALRYSTSSVWEALGSSSTPEGHREARQLLPKC